MSIVDIAIHGFRRITKRQAQKLFTQGDKTVYLCPCKYMPGGPWAIQCPIESNRYMERVENLYSPAQCSRKSHPHYIAKTAWEQMYNNWAYYNTSWELGYYAHYYVVDIPPQSQEDIELDRQFLYHTFQQPE